MERTVSVSKCRHRVVYGEEVEEAEKMKLPTKVRVNGADWKIMVDELKMTDNGNYGETDHRQRTITMATRYPGSRVRATLLHELIHVASDTLYNDNQPSELQVSVIAANLYEALFVGNPDVLAFLSESDDDENGD